MAWLDLASAAGLVQLEHLGMPSADSSARPMALGYFSQDLPVSLSVGSHLLSKRQTSSCPLLHIQSGPTPQKHSSCPVCFRAGASQELLAS